MWPTFFTCMKFEYICKKFTNIRIYSYPNFLLVWIFEYIRIPIFIYSYSNIKYSAKNIQIFEYIRIFATLWSGTCITPSEDLHHTIRRPVSNHPRTCITPSKDLQQIIQMDLHVTQAGEPWMPAGVMQVWMCTWKLLP